MEVPRLNREETSFLQLMKGLYLVAVDAVVEGDVGVAVDGEETSLQTMEVGISMAVKHSREAKRERRHLRVVTMAKTGDVGVAEEEVVAEAVDEEAVDVVGLCHLVCESKT
mmetsp:Transcript_17500/g.28747  ORF Transcript_17500/g.28747 Transcript_17500/m.28747 type:complete len:111 (+) Transcript_17500:623-955(+)